MLNEMSEGSKKMQVEESLQDSLRSKKNGEGLREAVDFISEPQHKGFHFHHQTDPYAAWTQGPN